MSQTTHVDENSDLHPLATWKELDPAKTEDAPDEVESTDKQEAPTSPLSRFGISGRNLQIANWIGVALGIYLLITAVSVVGDGFQSATGGQAEELFSFASNPIVALMIGVLATALIQSSSTVTSIVVGLVAGGLPMSIAIPMLFGANMGTTLTSTLVALGMVTDKKTFQRAYGAASVHDMYNLLAILIFFPLEMMTGLMERTSAWISNSIAGSDGGIIATGFEAFGNFISLITDPLADLIGGIDGLLPEPWGGILLIVIGIAMILGVINFLGMLLKSVLVGQAQQVLHNAVGRGPFSGILSGTLVTIMVQSSSTTTSLVVPLAGSGTLKIKQVYPFTVGANIGTTITALIAAFGFSGVEAQLALQAALVHMLFNVFAALVIFLIPFLRPLPPFAATRLAYLGAKNKIWIAVWVIGVFLLLPGSLIFLSVIL